MNDATIGGDFDTKKGPPPLPTKSPKVVSIGKGRRKAAADPDLQEQEQADQPGRNTHGLDGKESPHLAFLIEARANKNMMASLRGKWAKKVQEAKQAGIDVKVVKPWSWSRGSLATRPATRSPPRRVRLAGGGAATSRIARTILAARAVRPGSPAIGTPSGT
jgi:hypothetical protein